MMKPITLTEKKLTEANYQFVFPFSIQRGKEDDLVANLKEKRYKWFRLDHLDNEDDYYGRYEINHESLENYYLPFTNRILFPKKEDGKGFQRYSKKFDINSTFHTKGNSTNFSINSIDITVCPYQLGFLTLRIQLSNPDQTPLSEAIDFASTFRIIEPKDSIYKIEHRGENFEQVEEYLFKEVIPGITEFMERSSEKSAYFESFPFFEDNRFYVSSLITLEQNEKIEESDLFRLGNLDGYKPNGSPHISANNQSFLSTYIDKNVYTRWGPNTYYITEEHGFSCLTTDSGEELKEIGSSFYGEYYYGLLLTLFHKIILLKLSNQYSNIRIEQDTKKVEKLIHAINAFSSNYFFFELATQSQGRDIFTQLRKMFKIEQLFEDTRNTLESLYQYQDNFTSKQSGILLQILTLYSVITGIFGMNLAIEELKGKFEWGKIMHSYSIFEYIALFVTFTGVIISIVLTVHFFYVWYHDKKNRKKWRKQIEYPNTK